MLEPELYYHVYNRANGSEILFRSAENYRYFLSKYAYHINPIADTFAYCLMPNHFHFLIKIKMEEESLALPTFGKFKVSNRTGEQTDQSGFENLTGLFVSKQFGNLFNSYSKAYNKMYNRKGSLFMRPFKYKQISNDSYFTKIIHYIHANPVHHGFCKTIEEWPHSSYNTIISNKNTALKRESVLDWFGGNSDFIQFHQQAIDLKMASDLE